ncbi:DUF559 domain-containing protein [soil metagenome]
METLERSLADVASRQHGLVTRAQAFERGLTRTQVENRLRAGRWLLVFRGVYRLAGAPETWVQRALAGCLAAPMGAKASFLTAAALAGLDEAAPPRPHLTVGRGQSARLPGVVVHRSPLAARDTTVLQGVPATAPGRTLVDCASVLGPNRLQRMVDQAVQRRLVLPGEIPAIWDAVRAQPGRAGEGRLRTAMEPWEGSITPDSTPEARLRRQLQQWGYPEPELQVPVHDESGRVIGRVDVGWSIVRIGLEYDSEEFHGPSRWASDEARHRAIEALGWRLIHVDKVDLRPGRPDLRDALARAWRAVGA